MSASMSIFMTSIALDLSFHEEMFGNVSSESIGFQLL